MKDYKILFGYAAVLLSIGFVVRSITFAYAYPTGPNVSMGSNPQFSIFSDTISHTAENSYSAATEILSVDIDDTIITGVAEQVISQNCSGTHITCRSVYFVNGNQIDIFDQPNWDPVLTLHSGDVLSVKVFASGGSNSCTINCKYYIQGYYVHP